MKRSLTFIIILSFLLSSCSDESFSEEILGEWKVQSYENKGCESESKNVPLVFADENGCLTISNQTVQCNVTINVKANGIILAEYTVDGESLMTSFIYEHYENAEIINICDSDGNDCLIGELVNNSFVWTQMDDCTTIITYMK